MNPAQSILPEKSIDFWHPQASRVVRMHLCGIRPHQSDERTDNRFIRLLTPAWPLLFRRREGTFMGLEADGLLMGIKMDV